MARTTHRSKAGKKLYAVRDKQGGSRTFSHTNALTAKISSAKARKRNRFTGNHAAIRGIF